MKKKKIKKRPFYSVADKKTKHVFCVTDNIVDALKACVYHSDEGCYFITKVFVEI